MIKRKEYLDRLIRRREKQLIKVVTGVRRCGKSTLFSLYIEQLKETGVTDEQIVSINLEDVDNEHLLDYKALYTYVKYYIVDTGLRDLLVGSSSEDLGHLLENIVFLELIRRDCKVNIGKLAEKEVDFVAHDKNGLTYYQVSAGTLDENTLKRELEPLQKISDNHPKLLLTLDEYMPNANYAGIRKMSVLDWLIQK